MKIRFVGSMGMITREWAEARRFYVDVLGLRLQPAVGSEFLFTERLKGSRYFGVWPLSEAARICFGSEKWPTDRPVPQVFVEFEVGSARSVRAAAAELEAKGYTLLHAARKDPWGQTVARLQTKDGVLLGISYVPWMHRGKGKPRTRRSRVASR